MVLYQNGHSYRTCISLPPPMGADVPMVEVEMAGPSGVFETVQGKVDTGAFATMLTFATASTLGIVDPAANPIRGGTAQAADGASFTYYVHRVIVSVHNAPGEDLALVLEAGFAAGVSRNLFGVDWLKYVCVAIDSQRVHLLRD